MNFLYQGDAADVCGALASDVRFDLVYLDPPYGVGTSMTARTAMGETRGKWLPTGGPVAYEDRYDPEALVAMLMPRLTAVRERMAKGSTIFLHLDHRTVHYVKIACDRLFGRTAFLGEVVWTPGNGSRGARGFAITHQTILVYARSYSDKKNAVWNVSDPIMREPFAPTSLIMHFRKEDEKGRRYRERVVNGRAYRYYADEGRRIGSVWTDAPAMVANTPLRDEGTGYPTQKPERLLERIVRAASVEGAVVADLMCGSGTTLVVAGKLGRKFVGGDVSEVAIGVAVKRLTAEKVPFSLVDGVVFFPKKNLDDLLDRERPFETSETLEAEVAEGAVAYEEGADGEEQGSVQEK